VVGGVRGRKVMNLSLDEGIYRRETGREGETEEGEGDWAVIRCVHVFTYMRVYIYIYIYIYVYIYYGIMR
jgi:hypothetical protein